MSNVTVMTDSVESTTSRRRLGRRRATENTLVDRRRSRLAMVTDPASFIPTYLGVLLALIGFAMIGYGWAKVAGLVDVWRQMPYLVSAGLPGLGLVMTGLVVIDVSARRQDSAQRARQTATLTEALRDLQRSLDQ